MSLYRVLHGTSMLDTSSPSRALQIETRDVSSPSATSAPARLRPIAVAGLPATYPANAILSPLGNRHNSVGPWPSATSITFPPAAKAIVVGQQHTESATGSHVTDD